MNEEAQIQLSEENQPVNILAVISRAASDPSIDVDKMERLLGMAERMEKRQAEKDFAASLAALQAEMPAVEATREVPNNDGSVRYRFAPFEEIMAQVRGPLAKYKFSVSFDTDVADGRVTSICHLTHSSGYSKPTRYAVRIGSGPPKASESQADGAAYTYAKRGALCAALNIVIEAPDDDARVVGETITREQADELRRRANACGADESAFLGYAAAKSYDEIGASRFSDLDAMLRKKEAKVAPKKDADGNFVF